MTGLPIPLSSLTLGVAQTEKVDKDEQVERLIESGALAEEPKKGKS